MPPDESVTLFPTWDCDLPSRHNSHLSLRFFLESPAHAFTEAECGGTSSHLWLNASYDGRINAWTGFEHESTVLHLFVATEITEDPYRWRGIASYIVPESLLVVADDIRPPDIYAFQLNLGEILYRSDIDVSSSDHIYIQAFTGTSPPWNDGRAWSKWCRFNTSDIPTVGYGN